MSDYIPREAAIAEVSMMAEDRRIRVDSYSGELVGEVMRLLRKIPAADVRPVVRGKWERLCDNDVFGDIHCKCSACGEDWWQGPGWFRNATFCPNCGADMRPEPPKDEET